MDSPTVRFLIVNADDFGWSHEVNAAVLRTSREGVLTGTSLMVAGAARDEAVAIARECPDLDVGLHLVVCRGSSVLPSERLGGLVNRSSQFGENPVLTGLPAGMHEPVPAGKVALLSRTLMPRTPHSSSDFGFTRASLWALCSGVAASFQSSPKLVGVCPGASFHVVGSWRSAPVA